MLRNWKWAWIAMAVVLAGRHVHAQCTSLDVTDFAEGHYNTYIPENFLLQDHGLIVTSASAWDNERHWIFVGYIQGDHCLNGLGSGTFSTPVNSISLQAAMGTQQNGTFTLSAFDEQSNCVGSVTQAVSYSGYHTIALDDLVAPATSFRLECDHGYGVSTITFCSSNSPPVANAGPDQTAECTGLLTTVSLNASASSDPDGDEMAFEWSVPEGSDATLDDPFSPTPTGQFPLGPTLVTLTVTDGSGGVACDDVLITVVDNVPPVLVATTDKIALWPPNHEMHDVSVSIEVTDCAWDTGAALTAWVASSEPDDGTGDGSYTGDVDGQDGFAAPVPVDLIYTDEPEPGVYLYQGVIPLRAERDGGERSRVYSIACDIEDLGGNTNTASCVVVVPHDRRNK